jgi:hypothetical protein
LNGKSVVTDIEPGCSTARQKEPFGFGGPVPEYIGYFAVCLPILRGVLERVANGATADFKCRQSFRSDWWLILGWRAGFIQRSESERSSGAFRPSPASANAISAASSVGRVPLQNAVLASAHLVIIGAATTSAW